MGQVIAATSLSPPPPISTPPAKDDASAEKNILVEPDINPGPMEDLHKKCKGS